MLAEVSPPPQSLEDVFLYACLWKCTYGVWRSLPFLHNFISLSCSVLTLGSNSFYWLFHVSRVILALCDYALFYPHVWNKRFLLNPFILSFGFSSQMRTVWIARRSAESWVILTAAGCPSSLLEETRQRVSTTATTCLCQWEWSRSKKQRPMNPSTPMARRHSVLLVKRGATTPSWSPMSSPIWRQNEPSVHCCRRCPRPPAVQPKAAPPCRPVPQ